MTTSKGQANFFALAAAAGLEVDYTPGRRSHPRTGELVPYELNLTAPPGRWFLTSVCEYDCSLTSGADRPTPDWAAAIAELETIIAAGFCDAEDGPDELPKL